MVNHNIITNFLKAILEDLRSRWEFPQELCIKGSFLDPRFKGLDFVSQETREKIINQLETEYEVLKNDSIPSIPHYLNLPELPALEEYDSFTWWTTNKAQYPILYKMAMKYLSIPATSVPSERLFSDANNLVTFQRTRLDSSIINKIMFLKRNREHVDIFAVKK
ncbi:zinc finger BED domain-containing protein 4-like [Rhizophagus irregularis DAOM 181602=DAOM 197198]|nr:zinc finger BED domain-containing protein 4-like [Rhizophagus irregularis DAOM 181602=DAOM 197198]